MEPNKSDKAIADDVLHLGSATKLSPEQVAKAIAHHKKHHHDEPGAQANSAKKQGRKSGK